MITIGCSFVGKNHFVEKYDKKMAKFGTIFLNFLQFFVFFLFLDKFLCLWFCEHLDARLAEGKFSLDYMFLKYKKKI